MSLAAQQDIMAEILAHTDGPGGRCSVRLALDQLPADIAAGYAAAIALPKEAVPGSAIERALKARGVRLPQYTIQRHRRDGCLCCADLARADD